MRLAARQDELRVQERDKGIAEANKMENRLTKKVNSEKHQLII